MIKKRIKRLLVDEREEEWKVHVRSYSDQIRRCGESVQGYVAGWRGEEKLWGCVTAVK